MKRVWAGIVLALMLWTIMFSPITAPNVDFWWTMSCAAIMLTAYSCWANDGWWKSLKFNWKNILLGVGIAVVLWGVFWVGDKLSQMMFSFARPQVDSIYGIKGTESAVKLSLLLLLLIGPAEEIFWRRFAQQKMSERFGQNMGFVLATLCYTVVHISSLNFMLIMAAMVCGIIWGGLYRLMPERFESILISHALWDAAVFIWFPI